MYLKEKYLRDNYIFDDDFDVKAVLVNRDYSIVTRSEEIEMKKKEKKNY